MTRDQRNKVKRPRENESDVYYIVNGVKKRVPGGNRKFNGKDKYRSKEERMWNW